jgi:hypothetical protein
MSDLTNYRFGRLLVISFVDKKVLGRKYGTFWLCLCECGDTKVVRADRLKNGNVVCCDSCKVNAHITHNGSKTRLYQTWKSMLYRVYNKKAHNYKHYGGKGLEVCKEWHKFENFRNWALFNGYSDKLTIDRIDNGKGYSPENCRWILHEEQARNKSSNLYYTINGETKLLKDWAEEYGFKYLTIYSRVILKGIPIETALNTPSVKDDKYRGILWREDRKKWAVRINVNKKRYCLGHFDDRESAYIAKMNFLRESAAKPKDIEI